MQDTDLRKIAYSGQIFRAYEVKNGKFVFYSGDKRVELLENEDVEAQLTKLCKDRDYWRHYFDLERDYSKFHGQAVAFQDEFMIKACEAGKGIRILNQEPWEMLISFIISQRKSIPAIRSCIEKLCTAFGEDKGEYYAFPTPAALFNASREKLAETGLGYRLDYIIDAAEAVLFGKIDLERLRDYSDEDLSNALKEIKGVGEKVANCIMLFAYGRVGRVPIDTWVKKIIDEEYSGENPFLKYDGNAGIFQQYAFFYKRGK